MVGQYFHYHGADMHNIYRGGPINIKGQPRIESSDNHCRIQCELSMIRLSEIQIMS